MWDDVSVVQMVVELAVMRAEKLVGDLAVM